MTDEREPTAPELYAPGDIAQITDPEHPWYPALAIVSEVKAWGVQAVVLAPSSNKEPNSCAQHWNRLRYAQICRVGAALIVPG